jgi:hypothetical protein
MLAEYQAPPGPLRRPRLRPPTSADGAWDHQNCGGHEEHLFLDKGEVRGTPEQLLAILLTAAENVEMTVREAKNSDRQGSSSDSSPLPSEVEASTASTPAETRVELPGTSSVAVSHALTVLGFGELTNDNHRPPKEIWLDDEALNDFFDRVHTSMKSPSSGGDWEDIPGEQNEFTKAIRKG